jgi:tetratricopeptide (TPR) repeat protein
MGYDNFNKTDQRLNSIRPIQPSMSDTCSVSIQNMRATTQLRFNDSEVRKDLSNPCHNIQKNCSAMSSSERIVSSIDTFAANALRGRQAQKLGHYNEALSYFQCALLSKRQCIHTEDIEVQMEYANILFCAGLIYMTEFKNYELSARALEQCLEVRKCCLGSNHLDVSATMYCLAHVNLLSGDDTYYAFTLLNESLSILLNEYPNNVSSIIQVWEELARAQVAVGDIDDAESSMNEIRKIKVRAAPFL